jgi:hypothetical protein
MVDDGRVRSTQTETLHGLSASTFLEAHRKLEQGKMIGKLVIAYGQQAPRADTSK